MRRNAALAKLPTRPSDGTPRPAGPLTLRLSRGVPIGVALADLPVTPVDEELALVAFGNLQAGLLGRRLRVVRRPRAGRAPCRRNRGHIEQMDDPLNREADVAPSEHGLTDLLRPGEVAQMLGVSRSWLYGAAKDGRIPCVRLGAADGPLRFVERDLLEWLERARAGWRPRESNAATLRRAAA